MERCNVFQHDALFHLTACRPLEGGTMAVFQKHWSTFGRMPLLAYHWQNGIALHLPAETIILTTQP